MKFLKRIHEPEFKREIVKWPFAEIATLDWKIAIHAKPSAVFNKTFDERQILQIMNCDLDANEYFDRLWVYPPSSVESINSWTNYIDVLLEIQDLRRKAKKEAAKIARPKRVDRSLGL